MLVYDDDEELTTTQHICESVTKCMVVIIKRKVCVYLPSSQTTILILNHPLFAYWTKLDT